MVGRPFQKGQSGNPGGRPKAEADIRDLARQHTKAAISALVRALGDDRTAVPAAVALLDRGYGRPAQKTDIDLTVRHTLVDILAGLGAGEGEDLAGEPGALRNGSVAGHA